MKHYLSFIILILCLSFVLSPRAITYNEARIIAENWTEILEENFSDQVRVLDGNEIIKEGRTVAYIFSFYPQGYMMVSGYDYLPPVKMYSLESNYEPLNNPFINLMCNNLSILIREIEKEGLDRSETFSIKNRRSFKNLLNKTLDDPGRPAGNALNVSEVKPLLSTIWGQYKPYNLLTPFVLDAETPTGCSATAVAQVLNYYEWPVKGVGQECFHNIWNGLTLCTDFEKEYKWWLMLDKYSYGNEPYENQMAVAELMYDVGVALHMQYWPMGSGAGLYSRDNFIEHFLYSPDMDRIHRRDYPNLNVWFNIAKDQIDNKWPLLFGITPEDLEYAPHAVVVDGYRIFYDSNMVHINFGWNSSQNGYYALDNIDLLNGREYLADEFQYMIINFYPYREYTRPVAKAPESVHGTAIENRSVFLKEYICTLNWSESPSGDIKINAYVIFRQKDGLTEEIDMILPENKSYEFVEKNPGEYKYAVGTLDKNFAYSDLNFISLEIKQN